MVEPAKVRDYLLSRSHPIGRFKAVFFLSLGYTADDWAQLAFDLVQIAHDLDAEDVGSNPFGTKYAVRGTLSGPNRSGSVVTIWFVRHSEDFPRFVTAYPQPP